MIIVDFQLVSRYVVKPKVSLEHMVIIQLSSYKYFGKRTHGFPIKLAMNQLQINHWKRWKIHDF